MLPVCFVRADHAGFLFSAVLIVVLILGIVPLRDPTTFPLTFSLILGDPPSLPF